MDKTYTLKWVITRDWPFLHTFTPPSGSLVCACPFEDDESEVRRGGRLPSQRLRGGSDHELQEGVSLRTQQMSEQGCRGASSAHYRSRQPASPWSCRARQPVSPLPLYNTGQADSHSASIAQDSSSHILHRALVSYCQALRLSYHVSDNVAL